MGCALVGWVRLVLWHGVWVWYFLALGYGHGLESGDTFASLNAILKHQRPPSIGAPFSVCIVVVQFRTW